MRGLYHFLGRLCTCNRGCLIKHYAYCHFWYLLSHNHVYVVVVKVLLVTKIGATTIASTAMYAELTQIQYTRLY